MSYRTEVFLPGVDAATDVTVVPEYALVVSKIETKSRKVNQRQLPPVASSHRITVEEKGTRIGPGQLVTADSVSTLLSNYGFQQPMTWCDDSLMAVGNDGFIWHRPAHVGPMWWAIGAKRTHFPIYWPHLIFSVCRSYGLRTFAHVGPERPTKRSRLYRAPLGNIFENGTLCWGNIQVPDFAASSRGDYEAAIFQSNFSHANATVLADAAGMGSSSKQDLFTYWKRLSSPEPVPIPVDHLIETNLYVDDLL